MGRIAKSKPFDMAELEHWQNRARLEGWDNLTAADQKQAKAVFHRSMHLELFNSNAKHAPYWCIKGDAMYYTAKRIKSQILDKEPPLSKALPDGKQDCREGIMFYELRHTYLFLTGLAIELYAKGVIMLQDGDKHVKDGALYDWIFHNVPALIKKTKIKLNESEKETLGILADHVEWIGRYPVPLDYEKKRHGGNVKLPRDFDNVVSIARKLLTLLSKHPALKSCLKILD